MIGQKRCHCPKNWNSKILTNQHRLYSYTTFHFILQSVRKLSQLMSTKKSNFPLVQTLFGIRRNIRRIFGRNGCRWLLLSQQFGLFTVPPPKSSNKQRIQQKVFSIRSYSFLQLKVTTTIYSQGRSQQFPKRKLSLYWTV